MFVTYQSNLFFIVRLNYLAKWYGMKFYILIKHNHQDVNLNLS